MEWKTIDSAPKDGTKIFLWDRKAGTDFNVYVWGSQPNFPCGGWIDEQAMTIEDENWFSYWMPVPEPPSEVE